MFKDSDAKIVHEMSFHGTLSVAIIRWQLYGRYGGVLCGAELLYSTFRTRLDL